MENAKIQKFKCDILSNFQTMWKRAFDKHLYKTKYETLARFARNYDVLILGFAAIWEQFFWAGLQFVNFSSSQLKKIAWR